MTAKSDGSDRRFHVLNFDKLEVTQHTSFPEIIEQAALQTGKQCKDPRTALIISYTKDSHLLYNTSHKQTIVSKDHFVITHPHEPHHIHIQEKQIENLVSISYDNPVQTIQSFSFGDAYLLENSQQEADSLILFRTLVVPGSFETRLLIKKLLELMPTKGRNDEQLMLKEIYCKQLFFHMLEHDVQVRYQRILQESTSNHAIMSENQKRIHQAITYIHDNVLHPISLAQLAQLTHLSKSYFIRLFEQETGMSPYQFITDLRIEKAKQWLSTTSKSMGEIAVALGYQDYSAFCKLFTKRVGISPSQFRKKR